MKKLKIAVCFSGESRTWKHCVDSIKKFFSSDTYEYVFFGHTWDDSFYSKAYYFNQDEKYKIKHDKTTLENDLKTNFCLEKLVIESKDKFTYFDDDFLQIKNLQMPADFPAQNAANYNRPSTWDQMSYSIMMSNELKTQYELENFMSFDCVVRARFDVLYDPESKFDDYLNQFYPLKPIGLYGNFDYFPLEHQQANICDVMYFGSSNVMNIVDGFYRYWGNGKFWKMEGSNYFDPALRIGGYNINLYKWITHKNIMPIKTRFPFSLYTIWSEELGHMWPEDFTKISNTYHFQPRMNE